MTRILERRGDAPASDDPPPARLADLQRHILEQQAGKQFTDLELLDMRPAKDANHETWEAYHQLLHQAGKLNPSE